MRVADFLRWHHLTAATLAVVISGVPGAAIAGEARLFPDLSPRLEERVVCSISAAAKYEIPANIVLAIAEKEGGKPGQWVRNDNDTYDVGAMQFNTAYLSDLAKYGIGANDVAAAGCYAFDLAAWRLRGHILKDKGDLWKRAANYHSRTEYYNAIYRADLKAKAAKWADWLDARFLTISYSPKGATVAQASRAAQKVASSPAPAGEAIQPGQKPQGVTSRASFRSSGYVSRKLITSDQP
ncbi:MULTISPECIES: transglycosylase SLT domain-containing protein [Xanthomonas]|uniref:Transglycosylase SLT domain-containing protein n=1 Tax=Xanthomonas hortorum pv. vitians TaxID=83224 RepID=A0AAW8ZQK8_9XANT|nr:MULTISPECIES: transglycosylase SLT domain-containing protein [Xanthomonas]MDV7248935.1 transglycosylase SLT domain-containing protein [Xanthomonas hortorum pv. vitians]